MWWSSSTESPALLQITLAELGLLNIDLHFLNISVQIDVEIGNDYTTFIEQVVDHNKTVFKLLIPPFSGTEQSEIQKHYGFLAVNVQVLLENISLLKSEEFDSAFSDIYEKQKLGEKGLANNTYQKVYFHLQSIKAFNESRRNGFSSFDASGYTLRIPGVLPSFDGQSDKYNTEFSKKKISERYENLKRHLHLTLGKWKNDSRFKTKITQWREAGWLDWQILMALSNYILNNKARIISGTSGLNDEGSKRKFEAEFLRLNNLDESESYIDIPIDVIESEDIEFWLKKMPVDTLSTFGLENGMRYPNFIAIRKYLNLRFSFDNDDLPDESPINL